MCDYFGVYDVHWPFLIEIHTVPLKRFVPSNVLQAVRALRNALAALAVFLAGVAPVGGWQYGKQIMWPGDVLKQKESSCFSSFRTDE